MTFPALEGAGSNPGKEVTKMALDADQLEQDILGVFTCACRQNRLEIAEHLLRALEVLDREKCVQEHTQCHCTLMEAYGELVHRTDAAQTPPSGRAQDR